MSPLQCRNVNINTCEVRSGNQAVGGLAIQSSTAQENVAGRAIDGDNQEDARLGSCTETKKSPNPWWRVDLKETFVVSSIRIANRGDCCSEQLQGAEVRIGNSLENNGNSNKLCGIVQVASKTATFTFYCKGFIGRYVNVFIPGPDKILALCEVEVFGFYMPTGTVTTGENVVFGAPAIQSSTAQKADAGRATDGNSQSHWTHSSCTLTNRTKDPWWRVDLNDIYAISMVSITNRKDCCSDRLIGAEIRIGNSLEDNGNSNRVCGIIKSVSATTQVFSCGGFTGQYVNVIILGPAKTLTLCEVQVFGSKVPSLPDAGNAAPRAEVTQSSTFESAGAERAIDGNKNSSFMRDSCTHTTKSTDPWWRADLKLPYNVSVVRITNRRDCCSELLTGAEIRIGDSLENDGNANRLCGMIHSASGTTFTFNCGGLVGRYVNIVIPGRGKTLTLCEVEIFGSTLPIILRKEPVASGVPTIQSSTDEGADAERANDGNRDSNFWHGSCARTTKSNNPWWRVDQIERYNVSQVRITNRADCCSDQLQGAEIRIGDSLENNGNSNRL
ncbi:uncharacterized protein LOC116984049 [Amblyraja radiata]|uniref:uncharacterized protein LOC116984049 n=1 Tax=Amblyraja radiata TaxID=386614 RepID=UPI001402D520|nr:uncharacterized protein LOC116984049 [Amblyraja radiata]